MPNNPSSWFIQIVPAFFPDLVVRHANFLGEIGSSTVLGNPDANFVLESGLADEHLFSIRASNQQFPDHYFRHQDFRLKLQPHTSGDTLFEQDATFALVPSLRLLDDGFHGVSFRSLNFPDHYLRHQNFHLFLAPFSFDEVFQKDATFRLTRGSRAPA
jgi:hypothetical protein